MGYVRSSSAAHERTHLFGKVNKLGGIFHQDHQSPIKLIVALAVSITVGASFWYRWQQHHINTCPGLLLNSEGLVRQESTAEAGADNARTRAARFADAYKAFRIEYDGIGRELDSTRVGKDRQFSLDFEVEVEGASVVMTPSLVMLRNGFNPLAGEAKPNYSEVNPGGVSKVLPETSPWFSAGFDGEYGRNARSVLELGSIAMTPAEVLTGSLVPDMKAWIANISSCPFHQKCSLGRGILGPIEYRRVTMECEGSWSWSCSTKDVQLQIQYTVGLPLSKVPQLLTLSAAIDDRFQVMIARSRLLCNDRFEKQGKGCSAEYQGLLLLSAYMLSQAYSADHCSQPKRILEPWLVRTHFGDMAQYVRQTKGEQELGHLVEDALVVADVAPDAVLWRNGVASYLHLPEIAELGGLVRGRQDNFSSALKELPTSGAGLRDLASQVLLNRQAVDCRLASLPCGIHGLSEEVAPLTARGWLQGVVDGRDLMSDHDSPLTKGSYSKVVWKSMGQWRRKDGIVHMECRRGGQRPGCLEVEQAYQQDASAHALEMFWDIARSVRQLDDLPPTS